MNMEQQINEFTSEFNAYRDSFDRYPVVIRRGHKFTRLVDTGDDSTVVFIENKSGDIYKPASNQSRAKGVRGNIVGEHRFSAFDKTLSGVVHLKRGRPRKNPAIETEIEAVGEVQETNEEATVTS